MYVSVYTSALKGVLGLKFSNKLIFLEKIYSHAHVAYYLYLIPPSIPPPPMTLCPISPFPSPTDRRDLTGLQATIINATIFHLQKVDACPQDHPIPPPTSHQFTKSVSIFPHRAKLQYFSKIQDSWSHALLPSCLPMRAAIPYVHACGSAMRPGTVGDCNKKYYAQYKHTFPLFIL